MTEYIGKMRKLIGHECLIIVGASVIAVKDDKILLQKRADNGLWGYAGGCLEIGETPEEAAKREFMEETGLEALDLQLYGVFSGEKRFHTYPNGDKVYITDVVYVCTEFMDSGNLHDNEVLELKWFDISKIPGQLSPPVKDIVEKFADEYLNGKLEGFFRR